MIEFPSNPLPGDEYTDGNGTIWVCQQGNPNIWHKKSACLEEAPIDGEAYARKDGQWVKISTITPKIPVPNVVGLSRVDAETAIINAGLVVGTVTGDIDPVISQNPPANTMVNLGTSVDMTLTAYIVAPNIIGMNQVDADAAIIAAGMVVGTVTGDIDPVIAQDPLGGAEVVPGSAMNYALTNSPDVTVPNIIGLTSAQADAAISNAQLVKGTVTGDFDPVISQNPASGTTVPVGSAVDYGLTAGIAVPNVVGLSQTNAETAITNAGLTVGTISGDTDPVVSQDPAAGTLAAPNSPVNLTLTDFVTVPNLYGLTALEADSAILNANLTKGTVTGDVDPVIGQSPDAGTGVAPQTPVDYELSPASFTGWVNEGYPLTGNDDLIWHARYYEGVPNNPDTSCSTGYFVEDIYGYNGSNQTLPSDVRTLLDGTLNKNITLMINNPNPSTCNRGTLILGRKVRCLKTDASISKLRIKLKVTGINEYNSPGAVGVKANVRYSICVSANINTVDATVTAATEIGNIQNADLVATDNISTDLITLYQNQSADHLIDEEQIVSSDPLNLSVGDERWLFITMEYFISSTQGSGSPGTDQRVTNPWIMDNFDFYVDGLLPL